MDDWVGSGIDLKSCGWKKEEEEEEDHLGPPLCE